GKKRSDGLSPDDPEGLGRRRQETVVRQEPDDPLDVRRSPSIRPCPPGLPSLCSDVTTIAYFATTSPFILGRSVRRSGGSLLQPGGREKLIAGGGAIANLTCGSLVD
ncbi:MAG: hypothetical protein ACRDPP_16190, partial [Gaiellaceae bacterium]